MKRTITAKAKDKRGLITEMNVRVELTFDGLTHQEAKERVEKVKDKLLDFIRENAHFYQSQVKIS